jgi:hypothetical protein
LPYLCRTGLHTCLHLLQVPVKEIHQHLLHFSLPSTLSSSDSFLSNPSRESLLSFLDNLPAWCWPWHPGAPQLPFISQPTAAQEERQCKQGHNLYRDCKLVTSCI